MHDRRAHFRRVVVGFQFLREPLVEGQRGGFRAGVVDHAAQGGEAGHAGGCDDVPVVRGDHGGDEFFDH